MKALTASVAALLVAAVLPACSEDPIEQNDPQLTLSWDSMVVDVGASASVTATVHNSTEPAQFISRDQSIATVNANGAISGVKVGSTHVVATLSTRGDVRDSVRVRVKTPPIVIDQCPATRPNFGVATEEDRALFAYDVNAPLNLQKTVQTTNAVFTLSTISYTSPAGGSVPGIMSEPVGRSGLRPGIVILHPSALHAQDMAGYAQLLAAHGAVVVVIDAPYWRRGGIYNPLFNSKDRAEQIQLMKDLQRAVDVLLAQGSVDAARLAFDGFSYGGIQGAGFVGIERRLKAAVLAVAMGGNVTAMTTPEFLPYFTSLSCAVRRAWFQDMVPLEPIRFIPNAAPTALFFQMGNFDTAVPPQDTETLYAAASSPKEIRRYDTGHGLNQQAVVDRLNWLKQQIGTDAPQIAP